VPGASSHFLHLPDLFARFAPDPANDKRSALENIRTLAGFAGEFRRAVGWNGVDPFCRF